MKIRIDIDDSHDEEIIIKCKSITKEITELQKVINASLKSNNIDLIFYKDNIEYYLPVDDILFFETDGLLVNAHTKNDVFQVKYKLYELEKLLPYNYLRISKSTIVNINQIYSISKNITSSSSIEFYDSYKQIYVSRMYYKTLKEKMKGRC